MKASDNEALSAIIMEIEGLSGEEIVKRELATGVPIIYELNDEGRPISKRDLAA